MWIHLSDSFLSIVQSHDDPNMLLVRVRHKDDIERVFPGTEVTRTPNADYLYRAVLSRDVVARAVAEQVNRISYSNFKDSVEDPPRHSAYTKCWSNMVEWQQRIKGAGRR